MATNKNPIATDSAAELHDLIGDDATATFESDPNFVDSNPTDDASSEHVEMRDTDDMEDSDEEEEEAALEDEDEEDDDGEYEDDDDDADVLRTAEPTNVHGPGKHSRTDIEEELDEMEDEVGQKNAEDAPEAEEEEEEGEDRRHTDRAIDEALRMSARVISGLDRRAGIEGLEQVG